MAAVWATYALAMAALCSGCATERSLDRTLDALDHTANNASLAEASIAHVATSAALLLDGVAATVSDARTDMIRCTAEVAGVLSETRATIASLRERVETPTPKPVTYIAYAFAAGLLVLLAVSIWTHLHVREVRRLARTIRPPPAA